MKTPENTLEILKILNKSNCRDCGLPTCLAFAAEVYSGRKKLSGCPHVAEEILRKYADTNSSNTAIAENIDRAMRHLRSKIAETDLSTVAGKLGGTYANGQLTIMVLGKKYSVTDNGDIVTDIHVNPWIALPVYKYILQGGGNGISGRWVPLRELPSGQDWYRLFGQRCEKPMKKIADRYPDLFADMVRMFNASRVENHYEADVSVVLHPLPKLPMLICYWYAEQELQSDLNLFFDDTAEEYLDINSINSIGSGFVTMLEKLIVQHG